MVNRSKYSHNDGEPDEMTPISNEQFSINQEARLIVINDDINDALAKAISEAMPAFQQGKLPITMKINSYGGLVHCAISILSEMLSSSVPILVDINGIAYSSAAIIALGGHNIRMSGLGQLMFHSPSWAVEGKLEGHENEIKVTKEHYQRIMKRLLKRTKMPLKKFLSLTDSKDYYLSPEEALKYKIVDELY